MGHTEGLGSRVRLGHAGLLRPEEEAVHVCQLHRVVVCKALSWVILPSTSPHTQPAAADKLEIQYKPILVAEAKMLHFCSSDVCLMRPLPQILIFSIAADRKRVHDDISLAHIFPDKSCSEAALTSRCGGVRVRTIHEQTADAAAGEHLCRHAAHAAYAHHRHRLVPDALVVLDDAHAL